MEPSEIKDIFVNSSFWQANFWGIVGTITGAFGLFVSWLNWRYSHPDIKITFLCLRIRKFDDNFIRSNKNATSEQLRNRGLSIHLDIKIANKKGGPGAIEKPLLIFRIKKANYFKKTEEIVIEPRTRNYSTRRLSESMSETKIINLGKSFNLKGGEILDDEIDYYLSGSNGILSKLVQNYDNGAFYILYHTNFGKRCEEKISVTFTEH